MAKNNKKHGHPLMARFLHWSWAFAMLLLGLTGFYIHDPDWIPVFNMDTARLIHFIAAYFVIFLVVGRIYYAFAIGDWRDLLVRLKDPLEMRNVIAYYMGVKKDKPDWGKYNPGQRFVYFGWLPLLILQAFTGFALLEWTTFQWVTDALGGLVWVRLIHLLLTWGFVVSVMAHLYLGSLAGW